MTWAALPGLGLSQPVSGLTWRLLNPPREPPVRPAGRGPGGNTSVNPKLILAGMVAIAMVIMIETGNATERAPGSEFRVTVPVCRALVEPRLARAARGPGGHPTRLSLAALSECRQFRQRH